MSRNEVIVLKDRFDAVRGSVTGDMLMSAAKAGGFVIEGHAKVNASRGRPGLNIQTGNLVNSINTTEHKKAKHRAEVNVGPSNVVYAAIHEFGGTIVPDTKPVLAWFDEKTGDWHHAMAVHIPARPYLRPAIDENEDSIVSAVEANVWDGLDKAVK